MKYSPSMLNSIHRSKRFTKGWKDREGPGFTRSILFTRAVRGTRVKRNRPRAAGGSRKRGKEASWDTRVNLSPRSIPSTGRVSMRKKKEKRKECTSLRKSTCHVAMCHVIALLIDYKIIEMSMISFFLNFQRRF